MAQHREMFGREYRIESEGEHPDVASRERS
jgi:hypothetical protein